MKQLRSHRFLVLSLILCLLASCGDKDASSESVPAPTPAVTQEAAVQPPQTTASPEEQTGFRYQAELSPLDLSGAIPEGLLRLGGQTYVEVSLDTGSRGVYVPESGTLLDFPDVSGEILCMAPEGDALWCCARREEGLTLYQLQLPEGTVQKSVSLLDTSEAYPYAMAVGGDGNFYLASERISVYSVEGKKRSDLPLKDMERVISLKTLGQGQVLLDTWETQDDGTHLGSIALLNTESIGASLTAQTTSYRIYSGWEGRALLDDGGGLYALEPESGAMEAVLDWIDTDVNPARVLSVAADSREEIHLLLGDQEGYQLGSLKQVPAGDENEKTVLTVGVYSWSQELPSALGDLAVRFNGQQEDFRVHLVSYNRFSDGRQRIGADADQLDLILTGKELVAEERLMDLRTLFDDEVGETTLLPCVQSAMTGDSGITSLPVTFTVETLIGSRERLGEAEGWTMEEFRAAVQNSPEAAVMPFSNAYDVLSAIAVSAGNYIDDFTPLLEAAEAIPVEEDALYSLKANQGGSTYAAIKEGSLLTQTVSIGDFSTLQALRAALGDDLVYKGYPVSLGNGGLLSPGLERLMIPAASAHQAEAWAFLKAFLTDEVISGCYRSQGFPVLEETFQAQASEAMEGLRYESETGELVSSGGTVWLDGESYPAEPITDADISWLRQYLNSLSGVRAENTALAERARQALKQVLEEGMAPAEAAKSISAE